jgi:hypothetical protein
VIDLLRIGDIVMQPTLGSSPVCGADRVPHLFGWAQRMLQFGTGCYSKETTYDVGQVRSSRNGACRDARPGFGIGLAWKRKHDPAQRDGNA